jgi:hypothetical protein
VHEPILNRDFRGVDKVAIVDSLGDVAVALQAIGLSILMFLDDVRTTTGSVLVRGAARNLAKDLDNIAID